MIFGYDVPRPCKYFPRSLGKFNTCTLRTDKEAGHRHRTKSNGEKPARPMKAATCKNPSAKKSRYLSTVFNINRGRVARSSFSSPSMVFFSFYFFFSWVLFAFLFFLAREPERDANMLTIQLWYACGCWSSGRSNGGKKNTCRVMYRTPLVSHLPRPLVILCASNRTFYTLFWFFFVAVTPERIYNIVEKSVDFCYWTVCNIPAFSNHLVAYVPPPLSSSRRSSIAPLVYIRFD